MIPLKDALVNPCSKKSVLEPGHPKSRVPKRFTLVTPVLSVVDL